MGGKRQTGHAFTLPDGTESLLAVYTFEGHPHIEVIVDGQLERLPLRKTQIKRVGHRTGGYRLYGNYRVPNHPLVPLDLRNAKVTIRLDRTEHDGSYNRAENLRPITVHDPPIRPADPEHVSEFDQLYVLRPGAESLNRWYKQHFNDRRAPAVGTARNLFMLLCGALLNNARAVLAQQHRLRQAA